MFVKTRLTYTQKATNDIDAPTDKNLNLIRKNFHYPKLLQSTNHVNNIFKNNFNQEKQTSKRMTLFLLAT